MTETTRNPKRDMDLWKRLEAVFPNDSEVERQKLYDMLDPYREIDDLREHWEHALDILEAVVPSVLKGRKFDRGPNHSRSDNLTRAMAKAWRACERERGSIPTARNVYDWLEEKGNVLEKEEADDGTPVAIHWKRARGKEEKTSYKSFLNRYTRLKEKLSLHQTSK
jgi:hypothetical protein